MAEVRRAERPLRDTEREGDRPRERRERVAGLEPAAALSRALLDRPRRPAPREQIPCRLEEIAERKPVREHVHVVEVRQREHVDEIVSVVAANVARCLVVRAPALSPGRHGEQEPPARSEPGGPVAHRRRVVLDVLEHLERADDVEAPLGVDGVQVAEHDRAATEPGKPIAGDGEGGRIALDADVLVALREPNGEGAEPRADLEHGLVVLALVEDTREDVPAQPAVQGQSRSAHGKYTMNSPALTRVYPRSDNRLRSRGSTREPTAKTWAGRGSAATASRYGR